ncbi:MAG: hypothetical protein U0796_22450 [Gemmatales bacterium]
MPLPPPAIIVDLLKNILAPCLIASFFAAWFLLPRRGAGLAVCLGFLPAIYLAELLPWWDSETSLGLWCAAMLLSQFTAWLDTTRPLSRILGMLWIGLLTGILVHFEQLGWNLTLGSALMAMLCFLSLTQGESLLPRWLLVSLVLATGLAGSVVCIHAHSARMSDLCMMWVASMLGLLLMLRWRPGRLHGLAGLCSLFFPFLLLYTQQNTFSELPVWTFVCLAAAPLVCLLSYLYARIPSRLITLLWLILLALAAGIALKYETIANIN